MSSCPLWNEKRPYSKAPEYRRTPKRRASFGDAICSNPSVFAPRISTFELKK